MGNGRLTGDLRARPRPGDRVLSRGEREPRDLGREPRPIVAIRGAKRAGQRSPQHLQRAGGVPAALVGGRPRQDEIRVVQTASSPSRSIHRRARSGARGGDARSARAERPAERVRVGVRGQNAERSLPLAACGKLRRQGLGPAPHSPGPFVPAEALPEDVAHDHAPLASDAERGEVRADGGREVPEQERGRLRRLQEARVEHRLATLGGEPVEGRFHARRQRLLLDEPDAVGGGEPAAQHARDRQEARRLRPDQGLEALPVEAKHAAPRLREDRG